MLDNKRRTYKAGSRASGAIVTSFRSKARNQVRQSHVTPLDVRAIPDNSNDSYGDIGYGKRANDRDNGERSERNDINDHDEYSARRAATSGRLEWAPSVQPLSQRRRRSRRSRGREVVRDKSCHAAPLLGWRGGGGKEGGGGGRRRRRNGENTEGKVRIS